LHRAPARRPEPSRQRGLASRPPTTGALSSLAWARARHRQPPRYPVAPGSRLINPRVARDRRGFSLEPPEPGGAGVAGGAGGSAVEPQVFEASTSTRSIFGASASSSEALAMSAAAMRPLR